MTVKGAHFQRKMAVKGALTTENGSQRGTYNRKWQSKGHLQPKTAVKGALTTENGSQRGTYNRKRQ